MKYIICDVCTGQGYINDIYDECPKCKGFKKLNWIEDLFGKDISRLTHREILDNIIERESGKLAMEIDKMILKQIIYEAEKK
jgi:RecJ-like exonuclease